MSRSRSVTTTTSRAGWNTLVISPGALRSLLSVEGEGLKAAGGALSKDALAERGLSKREIDELLIKLAPAPAVPDFELDLAARDRLRSR